MWIPVAIAGSLAALAARPQVRLAIDEADIDLPPEALLEQLRTRFLDARDGEILAAGVHSLVRRFSGRAGAFPYRTVELVRFEAAAVTFEHLSGPFAECSERFDLLSANDGGTTLVHSGTYRLRGGLFTAPLAFGPAKTAFEGHVRGHLQTMPTTFRA